jgi:hydroxypyruvate reductase
VASSPAQTLIEAFNHAVESASPTNCFRPHLDELLTGGALVLGAGKAAALMAAEAASRAKGPMRGLVVTRYGHGLKPWESAGSIEVIEAGHPLPDSAGVEAGKRMLDLASSIQKSEKLYFIVSGGGSALCTAPLSGVSLDQKRAASGFLMRNGADISEINCVRRHLSSIKGGRLAAAAHPAQVVTLAISDVPGDNLCDIASGPTVPDPTSQVNALAILEKYGFQDLDALRPVLTDPKNETPKPGDPAFAQDEARIIADSGSAIGSAQAYLRKHGFDVIHLGSSLMGDARLLGQKHARLAKEHSASGRRTALISGGETTVVVGEDCGRGGRNLEYLASLALELDGADRIWALSADTDGIDGSSDAAGAWIGPEHLSSPGLASSLDTCLRQSDTHRFFESCGTLIKTGPTRTNVNDFRLILIEARA